MLVSAVISASGASLVLTYDIPLDAGSIPAVGDFGLSGALLSAITGTGVSGSDVTLTLSPAVAVTESGVSLSYTPGASPIQSASGEDALPLVGQAVTNNSTHVYDPRDEGGAVLWTDMSDPSSYTESAGVITARTNKVSATSLTPVGSPSYQATGLNGLPTVDYNGTSQYFLTTEAAVVAPGVNQAPSTYVCVTAIDTPDRAEVFFGWGNSGVAANGTKYFGQTITATGTTVATFIDDSATTVVVSGTLASDTTAHVFAFRHTGAVVDSKIDNVADMPATALAPGALTANRASIGSRPDSVPDRFFDGQSSEEWLFNKALSDAALTRIYSYLKAKWGTP